AALPLALAGPYGQRARSPPDGPGCRGAGPPGGLGAEEARGLRAALVSDPPASSQPGASASTWAAAALVLALCTVHGRALGVRAGPPADGDARHLLLAAAVSDLPGHPVSGWMDELYRAAGAQPPAHHVIVGAAFRAFG